MSLNDPFFDAWVRDKLQHAEVRTPEHLWEKIRKESQLYIPGDRHRYLLILSLLLFIAGSIGYWAFHPVPPSGRGDATAAFMPGAMTIRVAPQTIVSPSTSLVPRHTSIPGHHAPVPRIVLPPTIETIGADPIKRVALGTDVSGAPILRPISGPAAILLTSASTGNDLNTSLHTDVLPTRAPMINVRRRHTYLELYAGPDHVTHYLKASSPAYAGYVRQAMNMEVGYPSFSFGFKLDMPIVNDDWRLQWGIHYAQINEQLHYFNPSVTKTVSQITTRSVVQPSGNTILVSDTAMITYKGQYIKESLNAYRMIDIPLLVSFTFYHNPQFQLSGSAGAFFNVVSWYNGDILDTSLLPSALHAGTSKGVSTWKSSIGTSLYGSLSLNNQLTKRVQVGLEPYLRYALSPVDRDVSVYKERFVTTGLALSIRYALGR